MKEALEIIKKHDLMELVKKGESSEVIRIMKQYPKQRGKILAGILTTIIQHKQETVLDARSQLLNEVSKITDLIGSLNEAFNTMGISPMINDTKKYEELSFDENIEAIAEDMKTGLDLYNVCAEYCRIYNANKT